LAKADTSYESVIDLTIRKQFTNSCAKEVATYLLERSPKTLQELTGLADQYLVAHNKKLSSKTPQSCRGAGSDSNNRATDQEDTRRTIRCYHCEGMGHRAVECPSKIGSGRWTDGYSQGGRYHCF